jgi:hypothetical protein
VGGSPEAIATLKHAIRGEVVRQLAELRRDPTAPAQLLLISIESPGRPRVSKMRKKSESAAATASPLTAISHPLHVRSFSADPGGAPDRAKVTPRKYARGTTP